MVLFNASLSGVSLFLIVWLGAWTIGGAVAIRVFLWGLIGFEEVIATPKYLSVRQSIKVWSREQNFEADDVVNLRVEQPELAVIPDARNMNGAGPGKNGVHGRVKFDFGRETRGFGVALDNVEAARIVADIKEAMQG